MFVSICYVVLQLCGKLRSIHRAGYRLRLWASNARKDRKDHVDAEEYDWGFHTYVAVV
jgi:hypothetical protein